MIHYTRVLLCIVALSGSTALMGMERNKLTTSTGSNISYPAGSPTESMEEKRAYWTNHIQKHNLAGTQLTNDQKQFLQQHNVCLKTSYIKKNPAHVLVRTGDMAALATLFNQGLAHITNSREGEQFKTLLHSAVETHCRLQQKSDQKVQLERSRATIEFLLAHGAQWDCNPTLDRKNKIELLTPQQYLESQQQ